MHLQVVVIFVLSFLSISANPLHRDASNREAAWADPDANHANAKTELTKDAKAAYKTHVHSGDLYTRLDAHNNPMVEEMRRKLNAESERLRARLRQELAELRERLSPTPAAARSSSSSPVLGLRARLRPLARQLQSTMSADTQELCGQLGQYLQGLQEEVDPAGREEAVVYLEAVRWLGQTLEDSGARLADVIGDFHAKASGAIDQFREEGEAGAAIDPELLQEMENRWGQEVAWLKTEVRSRAAAVKAELAALLVTTPPSELGAEVEATVERFCQSAALQNQVFQARIKRLPQGLEPRSGGGDTQQQARLPSLSLASSSALAGGTLQEDFSAKLSALIQDILTSVQSQEEAK